MVTDIVVTKQFKKDTKRAKKRGLDMEKLEVVIDLLIDSGKLPPTYQDHALKGKWVPSRELHIEPDWLLVYKVADSTLYLIGHGTHSDLFRE